MSWLRAELEEAIARDSVALKAEDFAQRGLLTRLANWLAYLAVRFATVVLARGKDY
jgi:hypothetical protein